MSRFGSMATRSRSMMRGMARIVLLVGVALGLNRSAQAQVDSSGVRVTATKVERVGEPPAAAKSDLPILALESDGSDSGAVVTFNLAGIKQDHTPLAQLQIELKSLPAAGFAERNGKNRGALHVWTDSLLGGRKIAGSRVIQQQRGVAVPYIVDVTAAVNEALNQPARILRLELRLSGTPGFAPVYALMNTLSAATPCTELRQKIIG